MDALTELVQLIQTDTQCRALLQQAEDREGLILTLIGIAEEAGIYIESSVVEAAVDLAQETD